MVRYFYALTPLAIVGTVGILSLPWLGLVALMTFALVALVALGALAWAIIVAPYLLIRSIGRRWHGRSVAHQPSAALSLAEHERAYLEVVE
jgi:hypothetical protein